MTECVGVCVREREKETEMQTDKDTHTHTHFHKERNIYICIIILKLKEGNISIWSFISIASSTQCWKDIDGAVIREIIVKKGNMSVCERSTHTHTHTHKERGVHLFIS